MPEEMDVMDKRAMAIVDIWSSVRAKRTAVPEIVAMASERRNHDRRNMSVCRRLTARFRVRQNERSENEV